MDREDLKAQVDELMQQYANEEIDSSDYFKEIMELTRSSKDEEK